MAVSHTSRPTAFRAQTLAHGHSRPFICPMPALTRRRFPERPDCWHVFYDDVHIGTIAVRPGVPVDADQWGWDIAFYPGTKPHQERGGIAATLDHARISFEAAWQALLPNLTEADAPAMP